MHVRVKEYLEKKEQEQEEKQKLKEEERRRNQENHLFRLGIFEKVYSEGDVSQEYPEYDHELKKAFMRVPIPVTDEEYAKICSYEEKEECTRKYSIAQILTVIAWIIIIGGFLVGLGRANDTGLPVSFFSSVIAAFLSGMSFLAFAEIIKLLQKLVDKE